MFYLVIYLALWPALKIASLFCGPARGSLVIQTAKIGDYINTTVMLEALGTADVVIDKINAGFARNDMRVPRVEVINDYRRSFLCGLGLCLKIFRRRYESVYVVMPGAFNLFLGLCALPRRTVTIRSYGTGFTAGLLTALFNRVIVHSKNDLTLDTYLKMLEGGYDSQTVWKLPARERVPSPVCEAIAGSSRKKAGICLGTRNTTKQIPLDEWQQTIALLDEWDVDVFVFGLEADRPLFEAIRENVTLKRARLISLLGRFDLPQIPANIARMNLFVSTDTGLCYVADCFKVPIIMYAGPSHTDEQRPINPQVLILTPSAPPPRDTYVFDTLQHMDFSPFYRTSEAQHKAMQAFISNVLPPRP